MSEFAVLIVVAHSDDETLGMGGTIVRHVAGGDSVHCVSMTDGVSSRTSGGNLDARQRMESARRASSILGFHWLNGFAFPDNAMDSLPLLNIVKAVEEAKGVVNPNLVYTHSPADLNVDHRVVASAVLTAFRPQPDETCSEIRCFEVASATEYGHRRVTGAFQPDLFVDMCGAWGKKREALEAYEQEMRPYPHPRSYEGLENLAKFRGNQVGLEYAEGFEVIRRIIR